MSVNVFCIWKKLCIFASDFSARREVALADVRGGDAVRGGDIRLVTHHKSLITKKYL